MSRSLTHAIFLTALLVLSSPLAASNNALTAYDILQDYHLPVGLLPEGVTSFSLNSTTGEFHVAYDDTCSFSEGRYMLKYDAAVTGYISNGKLSSIQGISVKFGSVWLNMVEILRRANDIDLRIGVGKAAFPIEYFEESPQCDGVGSF